MEPDEGIFLPYLRPLLDAPDSKYTFRSWTDRELWHPKRYIAEDLIPTPENIENQAISPILIVANMVVQGRKGGNISELINKGFLSHVTSLDLIRSVRIKNAFTAYGPTRILMWLNDGEKRALVPRTVCYRGKLAIGLESAFHVEEIAGNPLATGKAKREDALESQSKAIVAQRMRDDNVQIPAERQQEESKATRESAKARAWHAEVAKLRQKFENGELSQFVGKPPGPLEPVKLGMKRNPYTPEFKGLLKTEALVRYNNKEYEKLDSLLQQQAEIDRLDLEAHQNKDHPEKSQELLDAVDQKYKAYKEQVADLRPKHLEGLNFMDDDRRAFSHHPPLLSWDRRRAEPLVVQPDEFYPPKELALVDFQPLPYDERFPMTEEQSVYFNAITQHLLAHRGGTTLKYLDTLAPGAFAALAPYAPAVTDPTKGGRRDVESVRVRILTIEMLWQLAMAWDQWLFKPSIGDLIMHHTSGDTGREATNKLRIRRGNLGRT